MVIYVMCVICVRCDWPCDHDVVFVCMCVTTYK